MGQNYYYDLYYIAQKNVFVKFSQGSWDTQGYPEFRDYFLYEGTINRPEQATGSFSFDPSIGYVPGDKTNVTPGVMVYTISNDYNNHSSIVYRCYVTNRTKISGIRMYELRIEAECRAIRETRLLEFRGSLLRTNVVLSDSYPNNGIANVPGHGRVWVVRKGSTNAAPTISGADQNLGAKNDEFSVTYSVSDADAANQLTVTESLNDQTIRSLTNAPRNTTQTITISREKLYALAVNTVNTIEVKVDDNAGGVAYRRWTFTRTNSAPIISGVDEDIGEKTTPFEVSFSATDAEGDAMSAVLYLDDKMLKDFGAIESGASQSFAFDKLSFAQVEHEAQRKLRVEARDKYGATAIRNLTFVRKLDKLSYTMKKETDQRVSKAIVSPTWFIAEGAVGKVEVCNNAKDAVPTWEDMTEQAKSNRHFNLVNTTKTAEKWQFGVRITIERGTATTRSWLGGFGGAYQ